MGHVRGTICRAFLSSSIGDGNGLDLTMSHNIGMI